MMGPEEVLVRGRNVSVNGQLLPDGESQLLPGKSSIRSSETACLSPGDSWVGACSLPSSHCCWEAASGNERAREVPGGHGPCPPPLQPTPANPLATLVSWGKSLYPSLLSLSFPTCPP